MKIAANHWHVAAEHLLDHAGESQRLLDIQLGPVQCDVGGGLMQSSLFATRAEQLVESADCSIRFVPGYLDLSQADRLFEDLMNLPGWRQDDIRVYGKTHLLPRLHRWFADSNEPYRWSGISMRAEPFPEFLDVLRQHIATDGGVHFNTALGNLYRDGRDSVSWHSDDEPELGPEPVIASLSLGATRRFILRKKLDHSESLVFDLTHGSLLWMSGRTQDVWQHSIPKAARAVGPRINITFRAIFPTSTVLARR